MKRFVTLNPAKLLEASFAPVVIVLLTLYMWWTSPVFMTTINITNILLQVSILAIVAFGMTFVIIAGQLDLSQGSANALIGVIAADVMVRADNLWLGILVGLALGVGVGVFNGFVTAYLRVPSFITTLGVLVMARGLAREVTAGNTIGGLPEAFTDFMSKEFLGLGMPVLVAVLWGVVMHVLLSRTQFGLHVFSVGGNPEASHRAGINVKRVLLAVFIVSGLSIAVSGLPLLGRVRAGQPNASTLLELYAVAGVILGGTRLTGGKGSIPRTAAGVLLIGLIQNSLNLKNVSSNYQQVVLGLVFILAMTAESFGQQVRDIARRLRNRRTDGQQVS
ncbi:MAG: ABC transporter permease [Actinomycetota bacterium]|nr:ABC transporter permease [Actinomycetota bacterium]